jgi:hypothetical protein
VSTEAADHSDPTFARLSGRRLAIARTVCVTLVLLTLALFVVGLPTLYNEYRTLSVFDDFGFDRSEVRANLDEIGLSTDFYAGYNLAVGAIIAMACYATATIIFLRRSTEPIALLAVLTLVLFGATWSGATDSVRTIEPFFGWISSFLSLLGDATLLLFFYLFPNGRFVPRWTRWAAIIAVAYAVAVTLFSGLPISSGHRLYWPALLGLLFSGVFAQVYRYWRYSSIMERQQTKWVVFGLVIAVTGTAVTILIARVFSSMEPGTLADLVVTATLIGLLLLIPMSFTVAMLRYHLWNIDIIINRTLVYGALTALLAAGYIATIMALQGIGNLVFQVPFRALTGQNSALATVAATLAMAALFNPLRHRIQSFIDRSFYRNKYDAAKTLEAFSAQLRDETDLEALSNDLVGVVRETMQPAHVSLWLHPDPALKDKKKRAAIRESGREEE